MIERWVTKDVAIKIIREGLGASDFKARTLLDQAEADGVRLNVRGALRTRASIPDEAWLRGGMGAEGKRHMDGPVGDPIKVSEDDLGEWLQQQKPATPERAPEKPRPANDATIDEAITGAYDAAEAERRKPPNVVELVAPVQAILAPLTASGAQIKKLAEAKKHKDRRILPGRRQR